METLQHLAPDSLALLAFLFILFLPILYFFLSESAFEDAVEYHVPIPEQCGPEWQGKVLDSPSIKVR